MTKTGAIKLKGKGVSGKGKGMAGKGKGNSKLHKRGPISKS